MVIQFEAPDGTVLERSEQKNIVGSCVPKLIQAEEGGYWYAGVKYDRELGFLPAYKLAREVSTAVH